MDEPTQYCERLSGALTEPINTLTNLAFVIVALLVWHMVKKSNTESKLLQFLPISIFLIGAGSAIWHHSRTLLGDVLDTAGIALFAVVAATFILAQLFTNWFIRVMAFGGTAIVALFLEQLTHLNGSLVYVFLFSVLSATLFRLSHTHKISLVPPTLATTLLFTGLTARTFDIASCEFVTFGIHFIWHVAVATALYFVAFVFVRVAKSNT